MKKLVLLDEKTLLKKGTEILLKELGPVEATRFVSLFKSRKTDSVKRHRAWQKGLDKDKFFDEVFGRR